MEQRLLYIDYIKALGICLVILYHCNYVPFDSLFIHGLYAMCVPLFFVVNGYLMLRKEYDIPTLLKKNLKLLGVMFFWAFISALVYILFNNAKYSAHDIPLTLIRSTFLLSKPENNHLWFLKAIFVLNLLNPMIYRFVAGNKKRLYYLLIIMSLWTIAFFDIVMSRFENPILQWGAAYSVLYYLLGYAVLDHQLPESESKLQGKQGIWTLVCVIGICALLQWGYNWLFLEGPLKSMNEAKGWVIDVVWDNYNALFVVLITIFTCALFQRIEWKKCRFWSFVGQYSLAIYVLQTPIQRLLEWGLPLRQMADSYHALGLILPMLTLLVCIGITWLMLTNKYTRSLITI